MAEAGILTDPHGVELIDGGIIDMPAIGSPHAAISNRFARTFSRALRDEVALVAVLRSPLLLDANSEPEPDVLLLRPRADSCRASHPAADGCLSSKSRKAHWPTIAASSSRYTQDSAFQRLGSSGEPCPSRRPRICASIECFALVEASSRSKKRRTLPTARAGLSTFLMAALRAAPATARARIAQNASGAHIRAGTARPAR
jgi:hypothetical protein